jgi:hypothetical protein
MFLNKNEETPVTSIFLSVTSIELKTDHMKNNLLHIESAARLKTPYASDAGICRIGI